MPIFLVNLWLDGYDTEKEMEEACEEFIHEQLNTTASSVEIEPFVEPKEVSVEELKIELQNLQSWIVDFVEDTSAYLLTKYTIKEKV